MKKYSESKDIIFHTEMAGSPFFILKEGQEKAKKQDLNETATATAVYSRAWKNGFGSTDVYSIKPEQVSKKAKAGEYLGKGAFMIYGKKNFFRKTELLIAIGLLNNQIIAGPESAIKPKTEEYLLIIPGDEKKSDIAKKIATKLKTKEIDEIISFLPAGGFKIK